MPIRFQRRIRILPGLTLNVGKTGVSLSAGVRGAHITFGPGRDTRTSIGIPGTGLSWQANLGAEARRRERQEAKDRLDGEREEMARLRRERQERRRQDRGRADAEKARRQEEWRLEVESFNDYMRDLVSLHCLPFDRSEARREYAERLAPRRHEPAAFTDVMSWDFVPRTDFPEVYVSRPAGSYPECLLNGSFADSRARRDADAGVGRLRTLLHLLCAAVCAVALIASRMHAATPMTAACGAAALCAVLGMLFAWKRDALERAAQERHLRDRVELERQILMEQKRRDDWLREKAAMEAGARDRREAFEAAERERAASFDAVEAGRRDILLRAQEGDARARALLCEALLPLNFELSNADAWADASAMTDTAAGYAADDPDEAVLLLRLPGMDVVPETGAELTPAGRSLRRPALTKKARTAIYDDFAASFALAHVLLLFLACPWFRRIRLEAFADDGDGERVLIQGRLDMDRIDRLECAPGNAGDILRAAGVACASIAERPRLRRTIADTDIYWATVDDHLPDGLLPEFRFDG